MKYQSLINADGIVVMTVVLEDGAPPFVFPDLKSLPSGDNIFSVAEDLNLIGPEDPRYELVVNESK